MDLSMGVVDQHKKIKLLAEEGWKAAPQKVIVLYVKTSLSQAGIQSTTGHEKSCGKQGGPPPKAKYYLVTDSEEVP